MITIHESTDYDKFELLSFNRNVVKTKALAASMSKYGFLSPYPIHVVKNGKGKLKIKAGHHRFLVARSLSIPIKYVVSEDDASIYDLEQATCRWSLSDYLVSFTRSGNANYMEIQAYCEETGIGIGMATAMLGGHTASTNNFREPFKNGDFKVRKSSPHASDVKDIVLYMKKCGIKIYNTAMLVQGISKIMWVDKLNVTQLKVKIKKFPSMFNRTATLDQCLDMLEQIYNYKSQEKIPLKFLADEAAKSRNVCVVK